MPTAAPLEHVTSPTSPASPTGPSSKGNPLSKRINSILSSSYSDLEVRDALEILDSRSTRNTADLRRNLRLDVQKDVIDANGEIIKDFGLVAAQLRNVGAALATLQSHCASLKTHVSAARVEASPMLDEATGLMAQRQRTETKQRLLAAFSEHYLLSDEEQATLVSTAVPVDDNFFTVLVKAKRIQTDSQLLLSGENQRLGQDVLERTRRHLDAAFQKLFRWTQREFRALNLENPSVSASVRRSLRVLAERPQLFQSCLDSFAEAREHDLQRAFHNALTGGDGSSSETQKPIDFSAHEPIRYAGDMLAWAHATAVSEREALEGLFVPSGDEISASIKQGLEAGEPWLRKEGDDKPFDGRTALAQLVDRDLAGVVHLLQLRIEQIIKGSNDAEMAYRIACLAAFYSSVFARLVLSGAKFLNTLSQIEASALLQFRNAIKHNLDAITSEYGSRPPPVDDLDPPDFLEEALTSLSALLKSYETSVQPNDADGSRLNSLLNTALDQYLGICRTLSSRLPTPKGDVFAANCLLATKAALLAASSTSATTDRLTTLTTTLTSVEQSMADSQFQYLVTESGLDALSSAVPTPSNADATSSVLDAQVEAARKSALFQPVNLKRISARLDAFLPSALIDARERLAGCASRSMVDSATDAAAERFCDAFDHIEDTITALVGQDSETRLEVWPRSGDEVRVLLS